MAKGLTILDFLAGQIEGVDPARAAELTDEERAYLDRVDEIVGTSLDDEVFQRYFKMDEMGGGIAGGLEGVTDPRLKVIVQKLIGAKRTTAGSYARAEGAKTPEGDRWREMQKYLAGEARAIRTKISHLAEDLEALMMEEAGGSNKANRSLMRAFDLLEDAGEAVEDFEDVSETNSRMASPEESKYIRRQVEKQTGGR